LAPRDAARANAVQILEALVDLRGPLGFGALVDGFLEAFDQQPGEGRPHLGR